MLNTQQLLCRNIQICTSLSFSLCGASVSQLIWPSSIRENPFGSFGCFCLQSVCATSTGVLRVFTVQSGRWSIIGTPTLKVCVSLTNAPVWETGGNVSAWVDREDTFCSMKWVRRCFLCSRLYWWQERIKTNTFSFNVLSPLLCTRRENQGTYSEWTWIRAETISHLIN